ncbi:MAG: hypothetical protein PWQ74_494 [Methanobacteriaceae archaeon]|nr:hypothetical protein [Methanobacteriaceae archaeon]
MNLGIILSYKNMEYPYVGSYYTLYEGFVKEFAILIHCWFTSPLVLEDSGGNPPPMKISPSNGGVYANKGGKINSRMCGGLNSLNSLGCKVFGGLRHASSHRPHMDY